MTFTDGLHAALFRFRGLTPVPFLLLAVFFAQPHFTGIIFGLFLICCGELLRLRSVAVAGSKTRSTRDLTGSVLVTEGPFAYTRNPIYTGNLMIYLGVGLMSNGLFPWLIVAGMVWFSVQYALIISYEERFLMSRFGREYEGYCSRVNRFIPRFGFAPAVRPAVSVLDAFPSERRTLQAEILVIGALIGIYFLGAIRG